MDILIKEEVEQIETTLWVDFYKQVFGPGGLIQKHYPSFEDQLWFQEHPYWLELQEKLARLRETDESKISLIEPERTITVRLPKSIHINLNREANALKISLNGLCVTKLMSKINKTTVPKNLSVRGRRSSCLAT